MPKSATEYLTNKSISRAGEPSLTDPVPRAWIYSQLMLKSVFITKPLPCFFSQGKYCYSEDPSCQVQRNKATNELSQNQLWKLVTVTKTTAQRKFRSEEDSKRISLERLCLDTELSHTSKPKNNWCKSQGKASQCVGFKMIITATL